MISEFQMLTQAIDWRYPNSKGGKQTYQQTNKKLTLVSVNEKMLQKEAGGAGGRQLWMASGFGSPQDNSAAHGRVGLKLSYHVPWAKGISRNPSSSSQFFPAHLSDHPGEMVHLKPEHLP